MSERSGLTYRPGPWVAVVGPHLAVMAERLDASTVGELWRMACQGVPLPAVLEQLLVAGWASAPSFVVVHGGRDGSQVGVIVRGAVSAHVLADGQARVIRADHVMTWTEQWVDAVQRVDVPDVPVGERGFPLAAGVVMAGGLVWTTSDEEVDVPTPRAPVPPVAAQDADRTLTEPPSAGYGHLFAPTGGPARAASDVDHDDRTLAPDALRALRSSVAPPPLTVSTLLTLRFSTGQTVVLDRPVLVGREPRADRVPARDLPLVITVASPHADISRNQILVRPVAGEALAELEDLRSTNGTVVRAPDVPQLLLIEGATTRVAPGTVLDLGDGVTVEIGRDS